LVIIVGDVLLARFDLEAAEWAILAGHAHVEKHLDRNTFIPFQSSSISGIGFIVIL